MVKLSYPIFFLANLLVSLHVVIVTSPLSFFLFLFGIISTIGILIKMENSSRTIVKLYATNYSIWKIMMEDHLYYKDLYEPIEGDVVKLEKALEKDWTIMKKRTLAIIVSV